MEPSGRSSISVVKGEALSEAVPSGALIELMVLV
jgi:hypothetical protein